MGHSRRRVKPGAAGARAACQWLSKETRALAAVNIATKKDNSHLFMATHCSNSRKKGLKLIMFSEDEERDDFPREHDILNSDFPFVFTEV